MSSLSSPKSTHLASDVWDVRIQRGAVVLLAALALTLLGMGVALYAKPSPAVFLTEGNQP